MNPFQFESSWNNKLNIDFEPSINVQFCLHSGSDTYKEQALAYLKTLYVNVNDSSEETGALNGSYSGDIDSCCSNPYLQVPYTGIRCDAYTGIRCDAFVLIRISDCYCNLIKAGPHMN